MSNLHTAQWVTRLATVCLAFCIGVLLSIVAFSDGPSTAWSDQVLFATASPAGPADPADPAKLAKGKFLVAGRYLNDPNFSESVVLLLGYGQQGALGVIINRPTSVPLAEVLPDSVQAQPPSGFVYIGGPVARTVMLLLLRSTHQSDDIEHVFDDVYFSGSQMVLQKKIDEQGSIFRLYSGHAGWGPGQLDNEVARGDWHIVTADTKTLFNTPSEKIWPALIQRSEGRWVRHDVNDRTLMSAVSRGAWTRTERDDESIRRGDATDP